MNLSDLNKIDIKDINFAKLRDQLLERQEILLSLAIVVVSVLLLGNMVRGHLIQKKEMTERLTSLQEKVTIIKALNASQDKLKAFQDSLAQGVPADNLIEKITDFAAGHNIEILSFSPAKEEVKPFYKQISVNLDISAVSYADILRFVYAIENSPDNLRVKHWTGSLSQPAIRGQSSGDNAIKVQLEINSTNFIR